MEVNPRLWQWHGLARACGVDLPRIAYEDTLGRPLPPVRSGPEHDGRRWVAAVAHLRSSHAEGSGLRETLAPLRGGDVVEATFDLHDPLPTLISASGLVTAPVLRGARRIMGRSRR
jgi:predicted ATP-grasp superfamily ATP-dependent carboligase